MSHHFSALANRLPQPTMELFTSAAPKDAIPFTSGQPATDALPLNLLAPLVADLFHHSPELFCYPAARGDEELLNLLSRDSTKLGFQTRQSPRNFVVTNGALGGANLIAEMILSEGDVVLVEEPSYPEAVGCFLKAGASVLGVAYDDEGPLPDVVETLAKKQKARLFYCIPHFQNPTGRTISLKRRQELAQVAQRCDLLIFEDDPYRELFFQESPLPALASFAPEQSIYSGSFSKTVAPGLRCGWLMAPERLASKLVHLQLLVNMSLPVFIQRALARLVELDEFALHLATLRENLKTRCEMLTSILSAQGPSEISWNQPSGGMFLWCRVQGSDSEDLTAQLARRGVAVLPGSCFSVQQGCADYVRLTFGRQSMKDLEKGSHQLATALKEIVHSRQD